MISEEREGEPRRRNISRDYGGSLRPGAVFPDGRPFNGTSSSGPEEPNRSLHRYLEEEDDEQRRKVFLGICGQLREKRTLRGKSADDSPHD